MALLWTGVLRRDVTVAKDETKDARQEIADYKQTVISLECELSSAQDVERMLSEQVL